MNTPQDNSAANVIVAILLVGGFIAMAVTGGLHKAKRELRSEARERGHARGDAIAKRGRARAVSASKLRSDFDRRMKK